MVSKLMLALLLSAAAAPAADPMPKPGSYGFNWLDPSSPCKQLSAKDLAKASTCEATDNAFGIDLKAHTCKVSAKVEWIVYDTAEHCQQAWETMQANGD